MARVNSVLTPKSSFLAMEKDLTLIIDAMMQNNRLKKLLYYTTRDALHRDNLTNIESRELIGKNIKIVPKIYVDKSVLAYIIISFDNFVTNAENPQFRDCYVTFDIVCHFDQWQLDNNELRPYRIAAELDTMFNNKHLTGIGTFQFAGCRQIVLNDEFAGVTLMYEAIHGGEDENFNKDKRDLLSPVEEEQYNKEFKELYGSDKWIID